MKKKDLAPITAMGILTISMILILIFVKNKKVLISSGLVYFVLCNSIIAYRRWIKPANIMIGFVVLFFSWLFTWLFLKDIVGYGLMKTLLIINYGLYIINSLMVIVGFFLRKKRTIPHYISLVWFILTTIIISYILYIYVFNFIFMLSF